MKTADFLRQHDACHDGAKWALSVSSDMSAVWDALVDQGKHEWLIWTATRPGVFPESILQKLTCRLVRETPLRDGGTVWDLLTDDRSRKAVEVAERYVDGKATKKELVDAALAALAAANAAAHAAAYAAAHAAHAAAHAAYCAAGAAADDAAEAAQVQMIAELGNPFKEGEANENR